MREILEVLEEMARQHCYTETGTFYPGRTDSGHISANAEALRMLARHDRFRLVKNSGRIVAGYWPENDPLKLEVKP